MKLKVLTWNIWGGKQRDTIIKGLQSLDFDIAALQEITVREQQGKLENDAEIIAQSLDMSYSYAKAFRTDRHTPIYDLGNAIISRFPFSNSVTHMLSDLSSYKKNSTTEPRNALSIQIETDSKPLTVVSTHLGYSDTLGEGELQLIQAQSLLKSIPSTRTILMGDFNSTPSSSVTQSVKQTFKDTHTNPPNNTWTNMRVEEKPQFCIDYIFISSDLEVLSSEVINLPGSDHFPVVAEIEV